MKELPKALDSEQAVLGAMLAYENLIDKVIDELKVEDFYYSSHRVIYEELCSLFNENLVCDLVTLTNRLRLKNKLEQAGNPSYLAQLIEGATVSDNIKYHCDVIKDMCKRRSLIKYSNDILRKAYDEVTKCSEVIGQAADNLYALAEVRGNTYKLEQCVNSSLHRIEERIKLGGKLTGVSTGFNKFDCVTGGLQKGEYIIIAARPSMGKTAFALNMATYVAKDNKEKRVAIFSFEMPKEQLLDRIFSYEANVKLDAIKNGKLTDKDIEKIATVSSDLSKRSIDIYDGPALKVSEIRSICMKLKMKEGLDVVMIDYIQLIKSEKESDNRNLEMTKISAALKSMAKELKITVIVLSQLSRGCEARADKRPMLSDLRDSGSLEQDADIIGFLYRDEYYYESENGVRKPCEFLIHKNRNGQTGVLKYKWQGQYQRFTEI